LFRRLSVSRKAVIKIDAMSDREALVDEAVRMGAKIHEVTRWTRADLRRYLASRKHEALRRPALPCELADRRRPPAQPLHPRFSTEEAKHVAELMAQSVEEAMHQPASYAEAFAGHELPEFKWQNYASMDEGIREVGLLIEDVDRRMQFYSQRIQTADDHMAAAPELFPPSEVRELKEEIAANRRVLLQYAEWLDTVCDGMTRWSDSKQSVAMRMQSGGTSAELCQRMIDSVRPLAALVDTYRSRAAVIRKQAS